MKKAILITGLVAIFSANLFASSDSEEFFYKRGYQAGYNNGYELGKEDAIKMSKQILEEYKESMRSYDIGKYLVQEQYLTAPQVWQQKDAQGNIKLIIVPATIEKELDIAGLFKKFGSFPQREYSENEAVLSLEQNSVHLTTRDNKPNILPSPSNRDSSIITIKLPKSWKNEDILKKANLVFSEDGDFYRVMFFSLQEKRDFCDGLGICK